MSIDRQRISAVAALEALGFRYTSDRGWFPPINSGCGTVGGNIAEADAMHALLVIRADVLMGAPEASDAERPSSSSLPMRLKHMKSSAGREAKYRAVRAEEEGNGHLIGNVSHPTALPRHDGCRKVTPLRPRRLGNPLGLQHGGRKHGRS